MLALAVTKVSAVPKYAHICEGSLLWCLNKHTTKDFTERWFSFLLRLVVASGSEHWQHLLGNRGKCGEPHGLFSACCVIRMNSCQKGVFLLWWLCILGGWSSPGSVKAAWMSWMQFVHAVPGSLGRLVSINFAVACYQFLATSRMGNLEGKTLHPVITICSTVAKCSWILDNFCKTYFLGSTILYEDLYDNSAEHCINQQWMD